MLVAVAQTTPCPPSTLHPHLLTLTQGHPRHRSISPLLIARILQVIATCTQLPSLADFHCLVALILRRLYSFGQLRL